MIQGQNAGYHPAYYFVLDDLVWRYDGMCVDRCIDKGRLRSEAEFKALNERMKPFLHTPFDYIQSIKDFEVSQALAYPANDDIGYSNAVEIKGGGNGISI